MTTVKFAFFNVGDGADVKKEEDLDFFAAEGAQAIFMCETGDRVPMLKRWCRRNPGWRLFVGLAPGAKSVAVLYRKKPSRKRSRTCVPRTYVGPGAGPSWAKPKAAQRLDFGVLSIIVTHMVASATRRGDQYRWRRRHYKLHLAVLEGMVRRVRRRGRKAVVIGDMNAHPNHWLLGPFREVMDQHVPVATHQHGLFDQLWATPGVEIMSVVTVATSSDHDGVIAEVRA